MPCGKHVFFEPNSTIIPIKLTKNEERPRCFRLQPPNPNNEARPAARLLNLSRYECCILTRIYLEMPARQAPVQRGIASIGLDCKA
jgi:hypothetical protein